MDRKLFASHLKPSRRTTEIGFLFEWLNFRKLSDVKELITEVLLAEEAKDYMDENRIHGIAESVEYRVNRLQQMILTEKLSQSISTQDDVERDIAADYTQKCDLNFIIKEYQSREQLFCNSRMTVFYTHGYPKEYCQQS